jgi:hypothetical protein
MKAIAGDKRSEAAADLPVPQAQLPPQRRNLTHDVLSERYHVHGRVETDTPTMAAARQQRAEIQRDHRRRRRQGEEISQTPTLSSLLNHRNEQEESFEAAGQVSDLLPSKPARRGRPRQNTPPESLSNAPPRSPHHRGRILSGGQVLAPHLQYPFD